MRMKGNGVVKFYNGFELNSMVVLYIEISFSVRK